MMPISVEYLNLLLAISGLLGNDFDSILYPGGAVHAASAHTVASPANFLAQKVLVMNAIGFNSR